MSNYVLNLDKDFNPYNVLKENCISYYLNIEYDCFQFSGGEIHFKLKDSYNIFGQHEQDFIFITNRFRDSNDIMKLLLAYDALKRVGFKKFKLVMPYVPYARQDRVCAKGESFSLKVFANIINSMDFGQVIVYDLHSDVGSALINNCFNISNEYYVIKAINDIVDETLITTEDSLYLVSPDSGANKKSNKLFDNVKRFKGIIKCDKKRSIVDGSLSGFEVFSNDLQGADCLIVDDIIDGGRTFIGIAEELKNKNAGNLYLFITHGIFSAGFDELKKHFKKIYCTNSFKDIDDNDFIKQFKINL